MLTRLILLKSDIENLALGLREQEMALLHADPQIFGWVFVGHSGNCWNWIRTWERKIWLF